MTIAPQAWTDRFVGLSEIDTALKQRLERGSFLQAATEGTVIFRAGQKAENLLLLLEGTVRVQHQSDAGREVVLYRVNPGESCVLTTACMLSYEPYTADGIAETDICAVAVPRALFDDLTSESKVFREFVFTAYSRRITDLFSLIDDMVFRRMDVRLAARLVERAGPEGQIHVTHQALATELGTVREVVSRTLSEFQRRGWLAQARGEIMLLDREALLQLAARH